MTSAPVSPAFVETRRGAVELLDFGEGPAVICLHGAMGGCDQSAILARTIGEQGYRYLALSRPGYLGTPIARGRSPEKQADLYAALLDALGLTRAAVMAVSGGGPSALHFALRHPSRCWGLVLVSTCADKADKRPPLAFKLMKLLARLPGFVAKVKRKTVQDPERVASRSVTNPAMLARLLRDQEAWALMQELQLSTVDRMALRLRGTYNDVEVSLTRTYPLEEITVPTLVVHGTADPLLPFARHGKSFAERIRGAELVALDGGEHPAIFTHRDEARGRVTRFLRTHAPGADAAIG